jgi:hypothetical protein
VWRGSAPCLPDPSDRLGRAGLHAPSGQFHWVLDMTRASHTWKDTCKSYDGNNGITSPSYYLALQLLRFDIVVNREDSISCLSL